MPFPILAGIFLARLWAQVPLAITANKIKDKGFTDLTAYSLLTELSVGIGPRLAGSENAAKAVEWGRQKMVDLGFQNVRLLPCKVPHWVRGDVEKCQILGPSPINLTCCALGQSPATPEGGLTGQVIEVQSIAEAQKLGPKVNGKIIFFNRPFDPTFVGTFASYGRAGDQRFAGPGAAAKLGAKAMLVRSLTADHDDFPHTGVTQFDEKGPKVPCAALSLVAADRLSSAIKLNPDVEIQLSLSCHSLPDADSADVIGEIVGDSKPNEVIVMGGHLDSWDKGRGAHDDGAGVVQGLEALRLIHDLGLKPKRTIRVCLWIDEEQKGSGSEAYLKFVQQGKQGAYAAIESDSGGFAPRAFGTSLSKSNVARFDFALPILRSLEIDGINANGETGSDIGPLGALHAALFGLSVESQRYFDYHHSDKDTIDKVNPRELELGAIDIAVLAWILANE